MEPQALANHPPARSTFLTFILVLLAMLALTGWMLSPYALALMAGILLMLATRRLFQSLVRNGWRPSLASLLVTVLSLVCIVGPLVGFAIVSVKQAISIGQTVVESKQLSLHGLFERVSQWAPIQSFVSDPAALEAQIRSTAERGVKVASGALLTAAGNLPDLVLQATLMLLSCYFLLIDGSRLARWLRDRIPLEPEVRSQVDQVFEDTAVSTIWATIAAAAAQSAAIFLSFLALGVPGAFFAAGATFMLSWVPMVGSTPAWVGAIIYLMVQGLVLKAGVMLACGLVIGVLDNVVRSWVLGGRNNMHPLVSVLAILGGLSLFGVLGVFLGPIIAALAIALLQIWPMIAARSGVPLASGLASETLRRVKPVSSDGLRSGSSGKSPRSQAPGPEAVAKSSGSKAP